MKTKIFRLDKDNIDEALAASAKAVRSGGTVVFPTETVYGLGANALDEDAVKRIFEAKKRPQDNPLIVHIADKSQADDLCREVPKTARILMEKFFPGPLTLIMKKSGIVPDAVSHGLDTVGIRMPSDSVANAFIKRAGVPIAAPSANISKRPSITSEKYLISELDGLVDVILLAGNSRIGVESTVLDVSGDELKLLRPGKISAAEIEKACGARVMGYDRKDALKPKSPGMKYAHYRPKTKVVVLGGKEEKIAEFLNARADENIGFMGLNTCCSMLDERICTIKMGIDIEDAGRNLYRTLREMDEKGVSLVYAQGFGLDGLEMAYMNRLLKAAAGEIINL